MIVIIKGVNAATVSINNKYLNLYNIDPFEKNEWTAKKIIIKKKFWNFIINSGELISNAKNLRFYIKKITETSMNDKTNISRRDKELYRTKLG